MMIRRKVSRDELQVLPTSSCDGARKSATTVCWPLLLLAIGATAALLLRALVFPAGTEPLADMHSSPQASIVAQCVDLRPECSKWAAEHQCRTQPAMMHQSCRASCKLCSDLTVGGTGGVNSALDSLSSAALDLASEPRTIEPLGEKGPTASGAGKPFTLAAEKKPAVVTPAVAAVRPAVSDKRAAPNPRTRPPTKADDRPPSAAQGEGCEDLHASCGGWMVAGECERNPSFMKVSCRRSCRLCPASSLSAHTAA